jgi:hypothetical protein
MREQGVEYEREKFQLKLDGGSFSLQRTTAWIKNNARIIINDNNIAWGADADDDLHLLGQQHHHHNIIINGGGGVSSSAIIIHLSAMLALVVDLPAPITKNTIPETLQLDVRHLIIARFNFNLIVKNTVLLVMANQAIFCPTSSSSSGSSSSSDAKKPPTMLFLFSKGLIELMLKENDFDGIIVSGFRRELENVVLPSSSPFCCNNNNNKNDDDDIAKKKRDQLVESILSVTDDKDHRIHQFM